MHGYVMRGMFHTPSISRVALTRLTDSSFDFQCDVAVTASVACLEPNGLRKPPATRMSYVTPLAKVSDRAMLGHTDRLGRGLLVT